MNSPPPILEELRPDDILARVPGLLATQTAIIPNQHVVEANRDLIEEEIVIKELDAKVLLLLIFNKDDSKFLTYSENFNFLFYFFF